MKNNKPMEWLTFQNRKVIAAIVIVAITFFLPPSFWILLPAYLMLQTSPGTPLRQDLLIFSFLVVSLLLAVIINRYLPMLFILGVMALISAYLLNLREPYRVEEFLKLALIPLIILLAAFDPTNIPPDTRLFYCMMGALLGTLCNILIGYVNFEKEFRKALSDTANALFNFAKRLRITTEFDNAYQERLQLETALAKQKQSYPNWVFEIGFNATLRSGFRYVLLQLDHIIATMTALSFTASKPLDAEHLQNLRVPFNEVLHKNAELLGIFVRYLDKKNLPTDIGDVTQDIARLEDETSKLLPQHPELIDLKQDYSIIASLVRDATDTRKMLLALIAALPTS